MKERMVLILIGFLLFGTLITKLNTEEKYKQCDFTDLGNKVVCPVTNEKFNITKDSTYMEYKGKKYFFCCPGCKHKFESDPEKYIKGKSKTEKSSHH